MRLWDLATGTLQQTFEDHTALVTAVVFSPNGSKLASASSSTVRLWDVATGTLQQTLKDYADSVSAVVFSPDGSKLALASNGTVQLWDLLTGTLQQPLKGGATPITTIAFSADGSFLTTNAGPLQIGSTKVSPAQYASQILSVKNDWIAVKGTPILRLSHDYRHAVVAIHNNVVALGCRSGYVLIVKSNGTF